MMRDESTEILDDILARWHAWAKGYSAVPVCGADPMFRQAKSAHGWDSAQDIVDNEINSKILKEVDFQVSEMTEPHRSAIYCLARNLQTGRNVWTSPRLPNDPFERTTIVIEARNKLTRRLMSAGVI